MVALGPVGRNVAAGMTGGLGYFFDEEGEPAWRPVASALPARLSLQLYWIWF